MEIPSSYEESQDSQREREFERHRQESEEDESYLPTHSDYQSREEQHQPIGKHCKIVR